jgi:hypothetical protein
MPSLLKSSATCPVCGEPILAISRVTSREETRLEFIHDPPVLDSQTHTVRGDDATMTIIFNRLSYDPRPTEALR